MAERALSALRFVPNASLKSTPFEAHYGREANTVLRNLTIKPSQQNLNWAKMLKQKFACLDTEDPRTKRMPHPTHTN